MRLISTFARLGIIGLLGVLLAVMMDPANWTPVTGSDSMTTLEFATAVLDDWAFTVVVLGALLTPADLPSMFMLALPLWGLFEFGIVLMRVVRRKGAESQSA